MKSLHTIEIRGRSKTWAILTHITKESAESMREDGLEVDEIINSGPAWVADWGLMPLWCFFQDILNFRKPWG